MGANQRRYEPGLNVDLEAAQRALIQLARHSAMTWHRVSGEAFAGEVMIQTANTLYRFRDGVFFGRLPKPSAAGSASAHGSPCSETHAPAWEFPPSMSGIKLIGFLADEGGLWSLSPRWRPGSLAVMCRFDPRSAALDGNAFTLTSPTVACAIEREARGHEAPQRSDVYNVPSSGPPTVRRPAPPSMTRLQPVPRPR